MFGICFDCTPDNYSYAYHVVHNEEKIIINVSKPINLNKDYCEIFKNEMDYVFNLEFIKIWKLIKYF